MKDLKHLIYFENLLMDADNELVREAQASGRVCVGSVCYQIPEVLMNLGNAFTVVTLLFVSDLEFVIISLDFT